MKGAVNEINLFADKKFRALGTIIAQNEKTIELLKGELSTLHEEVKKTNSTPGVRKSVTNVSAIDKFEKGSEDELNIPAGADIFDLKKRQRKRLT